mgnify:CR=1 FL=1
MEKKLNEKLLELHRIANEHSDAHLSDYIESDFLTEQVNSIYQFSRLITNVKRTSGANNGLGDFMFDIHGFERNTE